MTIFFPFDFGIVEYVVYDCQKRATAFPDKAGKVPHPVAQRRLLVEEIAETNVADFQDDPRQALSTLRRKPTSRSLNSNTGREWMD